MKQNSTALPKQRLGGRAGPGRSFPKRGTNIRKAVERDKEQDLAVQSLMRASCSIAPESSLSIPGPE